MYAEINSSFKHFIPVMLGSRAHTARPSRTFCGYSRVTSSRRERSCGWCTYALSLPLFPEKEEEGGGRERGRGILSVRQIYEKGQTRPWQEKLPIFTFGYDLFLPLALFLSFIHYKLLSRLIFLMLDYFAISTCLVQQ